MPNQVRAGGSSHGSAARATRRRQGVSEAFRQKVEACLSEIARRIAGCLEEAVRRGDLGPDTDPQGMADLLINCWEGAALRTRLRRDPAPLHHMLDFYFNAAPTRRG